MTRASRDCSRRMTRKSAATSAARPPRVCARRPARRIRDSPPRAPGRGHRPRGQPGGDGRGRLRRRRPHRARVVGLRSSYARARAGVRQQHARAGRSRRRRTQGSALRPSRRPRGASARPGAGDRIREPVGGSDRDGWPRGDDPPFGHDRRRLARPGARRLRRAGAAHGRAIPRHLDGHRRLAGPDAPRLGRGQDRPGARRARARALSNARRPHVRHPDPGGATQRRAGGLVAQSRAARVGPGGHARRRGRPGVARARARPAGGAGGELLQAVDGLRAQLTDARALEAETRGRLTELERELRAADTRHVQLDDPAHERLRRQCAEVSIITREPAVLSRFRDLEKAARSSLPILILGEPGTGKALFARAAHRLSSRASGPFVAVNMAAIPTELFESELFGHAKGSFTGAVAERKGYFEQADGGTIFLDEIGELRAPDQSKLLRVLQEKTFYRVGATRPTAVDVRVVAASNRDLERGVAEGWFREDLYFRLKGLVLRLPPLRDRRHDIAPLATQLLEQAGAEAGRSVTLSDAAVLALQRYPWPGNVRELRNCLRRAVALSDRPVLTPDDLGLVPAAATRADADGDAGVLAALRRHAFDMQATARALGWDRSTVTQRLKGLGFRALVEADGDRRKAALALADDPALGRTVELKLGEYHEHLLRAVEGFDSADAAVAACRRRFKNLPERHFRSLEFLVRQHFERRPPQPRA